MKNTQLDLLIYLAIFAIGFSVSELLSCIGLTKHVKRIADRLERLKD